MAIYLLVVALALMGVTLPLLLYIMVTLRLWNFHAVWDLAVAGNKLARWYMGLVLLAFVIALVAWFIAFSEHKAEKSVALYGANSALQLTADGGV